MRLKTDLASGKSEYNYAGRTLHGRRGEDRFGEPVRPLQDRRGDAGQSVQIRDARQKSLTAAQHKLEGMLASKRQLQVEVENLEARLQMIAAAKTTSNYQFDDSRLGRVKELVSNLRNRLEVTEKLVNAEVYFHDEIPLDKTTPENIVEQISEHFAPKTPAQTAVAKK